MQPPRVGALLHGAATRNLRLAALLHSRSELARNVRSFHPDARCRARPRDLLDVAIAGPLAGFVAAILALVIGLGRDGVAPHGDVIPASSPLFAAIYAAVSGDSLRQPLMLGPLAFAGYLGLVITTLSPALLLLLVIVLQWPL